MSALQKSFITPYDPARVAFGRHETFPLRYSWLTKGIQELKINPGLFDNEDATIRLGVGKNMVNSIRYWLQVTRMIDRVENKYRVTELGELIFDESNGYDPYLEDETTIWLIHWLLATNAELATAWYWFFNRFHKPEFSGQELATALVDFTRNELRAKSSVTTVKNDANVLLRMYSRSRGNNRVALEEALDSPLSLLNLASAPGNGKIFQSIQRQRDVPVAIVGFAAADLFNAMRVRQIPVEQLMYGTARYPALGGVFRLTESALLTRLEKLSIEHPALFEIRETAGIHQLYMLEDVDPEYFLERYYMDAVQEVA